MNEKAKATRAAKAAKFKSQTVRVDDNWTILRADELNWEIRYKDKFSGYFGTLLQAFRALPAKMLDQEASGTLADVQRSWQGILEKIDSLTNYKTP